jgi:hypothetical protein
MLHPVPDRETQLMASIALVVAAAATFAPRGFLRLFGIDAAQATGAGTFGWRLFAMRNVWVGVNALRGERWAAEAFLPVQLLDQAVFWQAYASRSVPRRAAVQAAAASGVIIALDVRRRGAGR